MYWPESGEEFGGKLADPPRVAHVDRVMRRHFGQRIFALGSDALANSGTDIVFGHHLRQDSIAQAERRVAKLLQAKTGEQFGKNHGSGNDDLSAPRPDSLHRPALIDRHLSQLRRKPNQSLPRNGVAALLGTGGPHIGQRRRRARGCHGQAHARCLEFGFDPPDLFLDIRFQLLQLAFLGRIVRQESSSETNRPERQTVDLFDLAAAAK